MFGSLDDVSIALNPIYIIRLKPVKCRPTTQVFMLKSMRKEAYMLENEFIPRLRQPDFGVINANMLSFEFDFNNPEQTTFDGIKCNKYTSSCGDEMYVHKANVNSYELQYIGGSL